MLQNPNESPKQNILPVTEKVKESDYSQNYALPKICMLDIETLDTAPTAKILSIGAVDVYGEDTFYLELDWKYGQSTRTTSQATSDWWKDQPIPMPYGDKFLDVALAEFYSWYTTHSFTEVWCKGSDFDFVILADAYRKETENGTPWKYNQVRDFRTLTKLFPFIKSPVPYKVHNALTDAICQAAHLKEIFSYVNRFSPQKVGFGGLGLPNS